MKKKMKIIINQRRLFLGVTNILNANLTVIEITHYQLKNILIKLDHIYKAS